MSRFVYLAAFVAYSVALAALLLAPAKTAPVPSPLPTEAKRGCTDYMTWPRQDVAVMEACNWTVWKF